VTGTTHALVGAAIGTFVRRPGLSFVGGVVSHGVLDCLPHRDYKGSVGLMLDFLGLVSVLCVGAGTGNPDIVAGDRGPDA